MGIEWVVFGINGVLALLYGVFQRLITTRPRMQVSHPFLVIACVVSRAARSARGSYTPKVCGLQVSRDNHGVLFLFNNFSILDHLVREEKESGKYNTCST